MPLTPAHLVRRADGTPYAPDYDDVYHSDDGGPAQAAQVFLAGTGLPARWAGRSVFSLLETGFGLGLNFLVTLRAWRADPARCARLHYLAVEKHPLTAADLAACHAAWPDLAADAAALQAQWPLPLPGSHRLHFCDGAVTLTLLYGDAADRLPQCDAAIDAFYLDGFAPARNPAMWSAALLRHCGRLAAPGAMLATYTTAPAVREALQAAGFAVQRLPGFGRKRHRLAATYRPPQWIAARAPPVTPPLSARHALVIGAGLAGAAAADRLAARGWHITVLDALPAAAGGASGIAAGLLHPHLSPDDALRSRLVRHGFLYALQDWRSLVHAGHALHGQLDGLAHSAVDAADASVMAATVARLQFPGEHVRYLDHAELSAACGVTLRAGGCWYPQAGWMGPASLIAAWLTRSGAQLQLGCRVGRLCRVAGLWQAQDDDGRVLATAAVVILASGGDAARLSPPGWPLQQLHGQLSYLPGTALPGLRHPVTGAGHALRTPQDTLVIGSSYGEADGDPQVTARDHAANLSLLQQLTPDSHALLSDCRAGYAGIRAVTPDHLPLVGAMPDLAAIREGGLRLAGQPLAAMPRCAGLYGAYAYGSRGLAWAAMAGEMLASLIHGEPLPLEADLSAAVDPARGVLRGLRRGRLP